MDFILHLSTPAQALLATLFTWSVTAAGAGLVFIFRQIRKNVLDAMLGFAAGVMIAASYFSLLQPAANLAQTLEINVWLTLLTGFTSGGAVLFIGDKAFDRAFAGRTGTHELSSRKRRMMLVSSITLHNIPEGMAVGVAFGAIAHGIEGATFGAACLLALGIGLQNFPEGTAVSVPLLREGASRGRAFFWGQLSGAVEPLAGVLGALLALYMRPILPFLLAFAAGAMIYVVVAELIPESQTNKNKSVMAFFTLIGFSLMMVMDVALG